MTERHESTGLHESIEGGAGGMLLSGIDLFVHVAETRSFTRTARALRITPSGVSRGIARLEKRLGVRLFARTTRTMTLTEEGKVFHERCTAIVRSVREAELAISQIRGSARGTVRADVAMVVAELVLGPDLHEFTAAHPDVRLEMIVRDERSDLERDGVDLAIVVGSEPRGASRVTRRLGDLAVITAAAPVYLHRHGTPQQVSSLRRHSCLGFLVDGSPLPWRFSDGSVHRVRGRLHAASGLVLTRAAIGGAGIVHLYAPFVRSALERGELVRVLPGLDPEPSRVYAIYPHKRVPARVEAFLRFAADKLAASR